MAVLHLTSHFHFVPGSDESFLLLGDRSQLTLSACNAATGGGLREAQLALLRGSPVGVGGALRSSVLLGTVHPDGQLAVAHRTTCGGSRAWARTGAVRTRALMHPT